MGRDIREEREAARQTCGRKACEEDAAVAAENLGQSRR